MECNSITYSFRVVSTKLEEDEVCEGKDSSGVSFMNEQFYAHKIPPQFERKLIEIKNNVSSDEVEYCKRNLQYRAMVIFRLATDSMSVTVMSSRLSFFDKMSAFGKIKESGLYIDDIYSI